MTPSDTPASLAEPTPHPLATELAARLATATAPRMLLIGVGSGRNVWPLIAAGSEVDIIEADPERADVALDRFRGVEPVRIARAQYTGPYQFSGPFDAALSTHALLHDTPAAVAAALAVVARSLNPGAPFFFTLCSKRDPRFGAGRALDADTFVLDSGSEAGVPHCYFDESGVRALLDGFTLERCEERSASETAGAWSHTAGEAAAIVHWFVRARRA